MNENFEKYDKKIESNNTEHPKKKTLDFFKNLILSLVLSGIPHLYAEKIAKIYENKKSRGSAFVINSIDKCLLGTSWHISKKINSESWMILSGKKYKIKTLWSDSKKDISIIEALDSNGKSIKNCDNSPFKLAYHRKGSNVSMKGYPADSTRLARVRAKIISNNSGQYQSRGNIILKSHNNQLKKGMSGGPTVDYRGYAVGVNTGLSVSEKDVSISRDIVALKTSLDRIRNKK